MIEMNSIAYYPSCSLKDYAQGFESSALAVCEELDIEPVELDRWNCCGTVYSLSEENLMKQLGAIRNLVGAQQASYDRLYTLCAMCYNALERANLLVKQNSDKLEKINAFMDLEEDYEPTLDVYHFLELFRDKQQVGWEEVSTHVSRSLSGLRVAPYYGCMLIRPAEVGIDDPQQPQILAKLIESLGGHPVQYPYNKECCGSYNTVDHKQAVMNKTQTIVNSARKNGAQLIISACPLCQFNLDQRQSELRDRKPSFQTVPAIYFTQLMAWSFGLPNSCCFEDHAIDPNNRLTKPSISAGGE